MQRPFLQRISERKYLVTAAAQVAALLALFWPQYASKIEAVCVRVAALVLLGLAAYGYATVEGALDAARMSLPPPDAPGGGSATGPCHGQTNGERDGPV